MPLGLEFKIAARYLRAKKHDGVISAIAALSVVGIAIGVATLIIVLSVMNGFREDLLSRILGVNSHISIYGTSKFLTDHDELLVGLEGVDYVQSTIKTIEGHAIISNPRFSQASEGIKIRAIDFADFKNNPLLNNADFSGEVLLDDPNTIILGNKLARALNAFPGAEITIVTPSSNSSILGAIPKKKTFTVGGTFDVGMYEYDRNLVYMPLSTAQKMLGFGGAIESIGVMIPDLQKSPQYATELAQQLGRGYYVVDWQQQNASFFGAVQTERNVMFIILTLIVLVASFNIIASMIMLTKEKQGSIAILRTMGLERGSVLRVFMMLGSVNGLGGTLAGVGLGLLFCYNITEIQGVVESITGTQTFNPEIYFLTNLPAKVDPNEVMQVAGISLVISLLATILPSWKAAKVNPAEALRYE